MPFLFGGTMRQVVWPRYRKLCGLQFTITQDSENLVKYIKVAALVHSVIIEMSTQT